MPRDELDRLWIPRVDQQAWELLDSIALTHVDKESGVELPDVVGLRDRALIGTMVFSFARVGAVIKMDARDYWQNGKRWWLRLRPGDGANLPRAGNSHGPYHSRS